MKKGVRIQILVIVVFIAIVAATILKPSPDAKQINLQELSAINQALNTETTKFKVVKQKLDAIREKMRSLEKQAKRKKNEILAQKS